MGSPLPVCPTDDFCRQILRNLWVFVEIIGHTNHDGRNYSYQGCSLVNFIIHSKIGLT